MRNNETIVFLQSSYSLLYYYISMTTNGFGRRVTQLLDVSNIFGHILINNSTCYLKFLF